MTSERRDRIAEISKAISGYRSELLSMALDEIHQLPPMSDDMQASCEHITALKKATDLFSDGLWELGYDY